MTTFSARSSTSAADESAETEKTRSGGYALTDATEDAVKATGPSPASAVITATPLGCPRKTALKSSAGRESVASIETLDTGTDELLAQDSGSGAQSTELCQRDIAREWSHATVGAGNELVCVNKFQRLT